MLYIDRLLAAAKEPDDSAARHTLTTPWGERLDPDHVLEEHPRPTMVRSSVTMLNGYWDYAIVPLPAHALAQADAVGSLTRAEALDAVAHSPAPRTFDGRILVPFSPEAPLSGVNRQVLPNELLWYRRTLPVVDLAESERLILHIEAVDWICALYVDGRLAGTHVGAYLPFDVDVTPFLGGEAAHEIALCVYDPSDAGTQLRGKQRLNPSGIWYTAQSGIWQSVWAETVPEAYLSAFTIIGDMHGRLSINATVQGLGNAGTDVSLDITLFEADGTERATLHFPVDASTLQLTAQLDDPHLWSVDDPYLYQVVARLTAGGRQEPAPASVDVIHSYCAFRTASVQADEHGVPRFHLNGHPLFLKGVLDQGYWPDGLLTAPSDDALIFDIETMKQAGFTMLRKHITIESARWYYHCDRLGMLVWQDAVSGGGTYDIWQTSRKPSLLRASWHRYSDRNTRHQRLMGAGDREYRQEWRDTCDGMIRLLAAHPSIVTWVLFNEGWGQFDAQSACKHVRGLDPSRPIDATSGWYDQYCGDYWSVHNYFRPLAFWRDPARPRTSIISALRSLRAGIRHDAHTVHDDGNTGVGPQAVARDDARAFVISEFGGFSQLVAGHGMLGKAYGYGNVDSLDQWRKQVHAVLDDAEDLQARGLAGYVYTQLSDVEGEVNGLVTYDRRVQKFQ